MMRQIVLLRFFIVATFAGISAAKSAEFSRSTYNNTNVISIKGEINPGDGNRFVEFATDDKAIVELDSPGGNVVSSIIMGEHIRMKGFSTIVLSNNTCASACALTWLAGNPRGGTSYSKIGFHAASKASGEVTGSGNAIIGAYLNKIGIAYKAIQYITSPEPSDMTWLTFEKAKEIGIDIVPVKTSRPNQPTGLGEETNSQTQNSKQSNKSSLICRPLLLEGKDPITSINITFENQKWIIIHESMSGAKYNRENQYNIISIPDKLAWSGQRYKRNDTTMVGEITFAAGEINYIERVFVNMRPIATITSKCQLR